MQKQLSNQIKQDGETRAENAKSPVRDILVIAFIWLMTLSLLYVCYLKFSFFLHHQKV